MTLFQKWLMRKSGEGKFSAQSNVERCVFSSVAVIKNNKKLNDVFGQLSEDELEVFFHNLESSLAKAVQE